MDRNQGVSADADRAGGLRPEPLAESQPEALIADAVGDQHKRCFTYCGDEICDCPANAAFRSLRFVEPALPVLSNMCRTVGLVGGQEKADEMLADVRNVLGLSAAQTIEARSDETPQEVRPAGRKPDGEADAPNSITEPRRAQSPHASGRPSVAAHSSDGGAILSLSDNHADLNSVEARHDHAV